MTIDLYSSLSLGLLLFLLYHVMVIWNRAVRRDLFLPEIKLPLITDYFVIPDIILWGGKADWY